VSAVYTRSFQGLASISEARFSSVVQIYSVWQKPVPPNRDELPEGDLRLMETLDLVSDAYEIQDLVPGIESGTNFERHHGFFQQGSIDEALLGSLKVTRAAPQAGHERR
jgi:hypothetical protein